MCGIAGIFSPIHSIHEDYRAELSRTVAALKHRGPDDNNAVFFPNFWGAHSRLAIIDLENGKQPMHDEETGNIIVFNGEIYNYIELRQELIKKGVQFITKSDTEVLLRGYAVMGEKILGQLNGMFAFAIYDKRKNSIFLARDRFGEKPLYYFQGKAGFYFASELSALREFSECPGDISKSGLMSFLANGYIEGGESFLSGVSQLRPGHYLYIDSKGTILDREYYKINWDCEAYYDLSQDEIIESIQESIRLRLRSDVPVACFLSGGVDSTIIATLAQKLSDKPLRTYTFGMASHAGELPIARNTAQALGTDHREIVLDFMFEKNNIMQIIKAMDMPMGDSALIPVFELSKKVAADGIKVVLSGEGGDELFGGYSWYLKPARLKTRIKEFLIGRRNRNAKFLDDKLVFSGDLLSVVFGHEAFSNYFDSRVYQLNKFRNSKNSKIAFDYEHFMAWGLLPKVDRMSMAHSLEVRVPFLDHNLVQSWACTKYENKIYHGKTKHLITKVALDEKIISKEQLSQGKVGLNLPLNKWVKENESLVRDIILDAKSLSTALFGKKNIESWLGQVRASQNYSGWTINSQRLWELFVLDAWLAQTMQLSF